MRNGNTSNLYSTRLYAYRLVKIDIEDVYTASKQGAYLVWTVEEEDKVIAVVTTRMVFYPKGYAMALDFVGVDV